MDKYNNDYTKKVTKAPHTGERATKVYNHADVILSQNKKNKLVEFIKKSYMSIFLIFIYTPLILMMLFAFNSGISIGNWEGWSLTWFQQFFNNQQFLMAILVSLIVSITATFFAVIFGVMAAVAMHRNTNTLTTRYLSSATNYPIIAADIVIGITLMLLFLTLGVNFGIFTLILAHILFLTPYIIIAVLPRLNQIDSNIIDASLDLGASSWYTFRKVIVPNIKGAIIAGAAIAFALSFDDFVISYFVAGDVDNASTFIYSLKRITPIVNVFAFFIIIIVASFFIIRIWAGSRSEKRKNWEYYKILEEYKKIKKDLYIQQDTKGLTRLEKKKIKHQIDQDLEWKELAVENSKEFIENKSNYLENERIEVLQSKGYSIRKKKVNMEVLENE